jgi:drug/metabolite transporter (DMT)-like permease
VLLGLGAAAVWGAGDFGGGLASRRTPVYGVVIVSQFTGGLLALGLALATGGSIPAGRDLLICAIAGVLGALGITMLYRGLALGRMGVVAPITGVLAAVIPVIAGFATEGVPGPLVLIGIGLAIVAVILVSRVEDEGGGRDGLREALIGGTAIGLFGVAIAQLSEGNPFGHLTLIRLSEGVVVAATIVGMRLAWRPPSDLLPRLMLVGALDMTGNGLYLVAVQIGQLAVASVLSALYPVSTVILATVVLREPVTRDHAAGIALAVLAIALIGLGGG